MSVLTTKTRNALKDSDFALPGRRYPIENEDHARNALARVAQHGTPEEQAKVRAAVARRYPAIDVTGKKKVVGARATPKQMMKEASAPKPLIVPKKINKSPSMRPGAATKRFMKHA